VAHWPHKTLPRDMLLDGGNNAGTTFEGDCMTSWLVLHQNGMVTLVSSLMLPGLPWISHNN